MKLMTFHALHDWSMGSFYTHRLSIWQQCSLSSGMFNKPKHFNRIEACPAKGPRIIYAP